MIAFGPCYKPTANEQYWRIVSRMARGEVPERDAECLLRKCASLAQRTVDDVLRDIETVLNIFTELNKRDRDKERQ